MSQPGEQGADSAVRCARSRFDHARKLGLRLLVAFAILFGASGAWPTGAGAANPNGKNYAGQWTSKTDAPPGTSYYGWAGVSGSLFWRTEGSLIGRAVVASWLSVADDTGDWVQAGMTKGWDIMAGSDACLYVENLQDFDHAFVVLGWPNAPFSQSIRINQTGFEDQRGREWEVVFSQFGRARTWMSRGSGSPHASVEAFNDGFYSVVPKTYFGTDRAGYAGADKALYLLGYRGWEAWDESLAAGTTWVDRYQDPPYHYSTGYRHYYFGGWNS